MMCMYLSMWMHAHIYSWKLNPGLDLLAKVCPLIPTLLTNLRLGCKVQTQVYFAWASKTKKKVLMTLTTELQMSTLWIHRQRQADHLPTLYRQAQGNFDGVAVVLNS